MTDLSGMAVQDHYPEAYAQCYGCGQLNEHGLHIRSHFEDDVSVCRFTPREEHRAMHGIVYGGLLASLIDCHATGTAAAAATFAAGDELSPETIRRFVTAHLGVDFLAPTPAGVELELRARTVEVKARKVVVDVELLAEGKITVRGRVICVEAPASLFEDA
jgi:acyl-coenzyme A thioesterase PaaI-like protein